MPLKCRFRKNFSSCCSQCSLKNIGYISGCLGVIWRTVIISFLSSTLSRTTDYAASIALIILISLLTYLSVSLVINCIFLYGVFQERRQFLLAYLTIVGLELAIGIILSSGMTMLLFAIQSFIMATYVICVALFIIGTHFVMWLYNILLYKDLEFKVFIKTHQESNVQLASLNILET